MAKTFTPLTSKPTKNDPYIYLYNNKNRNGQSWCINGKPVDSVCNVLCNCVGWACGRFNHIYNLLTGYSGIKYPRFCCNAENFIEVAKNTYGLTVGLTPKPGAIMVWQKGTLASSDGAGHVAVVEKVISSTQVMTSESGYGNFDFKNKTRNKGDGNWGSNSPYKFRGFIYNPAVEYDENSTPTTTDTTNTSSAAKITTVARDTSKNQIQVTGSSLRVRDKASLSGSIVGIATKGYYNYSSTVYADKYTWYKIAENQWIAYSNSWAILHPGTAVLKVGDAVMMSSNAPVYGKKTKFASWVYKSTLYVRAIDGDKITVSILKVGAVTGNVDKKYLTKK